jgi:hypothetical protein
MVYADRNSNTARVIRLYCVYSESELVIPPFKGFCTHVRTFARRHPGRTRASALSYGLRPKSRATYGYTLTKYRSNRQTSEQKDE